MLAVFRRHQAGITRSLRYSSLQPTKRSYALKASSQRVHTPPEDGQLPNLEEWRELFPLFKPKGSPSLYRPILHNLATAEKLVKGFGIKSAEKPKVVLEAFAGLYTSFPLYISYLSYFLCHSLIVFYGFRAWDTYKSTVLTSPNESEKDNCPGK